MTEELAYPPFNIQYLQITVDAFWHDQSRPFRHRNGKSPLEATLLGLRNAVKHMPRRIWVRVNIPYQADLTPAQVSQYISMLKRDMGITNQVSFYLAAVQPATDNARLGDVSKWPPAEYARFQRAVEEGLAHDCGTMHTPGMPFRSRVPCAYEYKENVCVDSAGYVYKCWHHLGVPERIIGSISKPFGHDSYSGSTAYHKWLAWSPFDTKCKSCKSLPNCMGFCYDDAFELGKEDEGRCLRKQFTMREDCLDQVEAVLQQRLVAQLGATGREGACTGVNCDRK